jgi:hypothetical protein
MLESSWREIEYRLDILRATKSAHVEVVQHSAALILLIIKVFELHFHIPSAVFFYYLQFENYIGQGNPDSNLESPRINNSPHHPSNQE